MFCQSLRGGGSQSPDGQRGAGGQGCTLLRSAGGHYSAATRRRPVRALASVPPVTEPGCSWMELPRRQLARTGWHGWVDRKIEVIVKGSGGRCYPEDTKKPGQEETKAETSGPRHLSSCPGRRHIIRGGAATHMGTSGGVAGHLGPLPVERATEPVRRPLPGGEAFSWERGSLLRGPLNWGKRVREGAIWGKSPRASLAI